MSATPCSGLTGAVRSALASAGDPARAVHQQAYMKSTMPFRGVTLPEVRRLTRAALTDHPVADQAELVAVVRELWDDAAFREERYASLTLLHLPRHRRWRDLTLLPLYEHFVVTGRWWDLVDDVATHALGELLRLRPDEVAPEMRRWAADADLWRRRAALVCQVGAKGDTDSQLLADVIEAAVVERDFFVRKGIGWVLRDYARTNPDWVREFVAAHADVLSPLSVREATKHLV
jgi:3-methyladenine DNA glycosylase AlkD